MHNAEHVDRIEWHGMNLGEGGIGQYRRHNHRLGHMNGYLGLNMPAYDNNRMIELPPALAVGAVAPQGRPYPNAPHAMVEGRYMQQANAQQAEARNQTMNQRLQQLNARMEAEEQVYAQQRIRALQRPVQQQRTLRQEPHGDVAEPLWREVADDQVFENPFDNVANAVNNGGRRPNNYAPPF
jgi:hypothetical protein